SSPWSNGERRPVWGWPTAVHNQRGCSRGQEPPVGARRKSTDGSGSRGGARGSLDHRNHLPKESVAIDGAFLDDVVDRSLEALAIVRGEILCGDNDHRDAGEFRLTAQD